ncbi:MULTISPECIES: hypothetical protein [unclassified Lentimonas]|uniref:hypothetical protein n=1 Tax=unclassified Lentimonas TaxID=2630993 RepID=UPI00132450B6|nr:MULTISPECIES: hypothetical protein [unclassified Lentimonas]CAA6680199.1 Unannotated [Lentimonas sp. CC4]CAA6687047.1 Unannotated [Lentimonas sp. CC6]CAA7076179.1 Unannotated [Lentimonas sp. CC4]CAA7171172.1 Unannotated [Lentimonas sp. CC21]CAA7182753.1 Unannotated [Lentimonas sp. CC8]
MISYLHILIRVEDDGSLHALGAFTTKEKETGYRTAAGLQESQVRLDFHNGPFEDDTEVIYAGHRRWNMDRFQLAGYFKSESEAWTRVTQDGYVSVLKIDTDYATEQALKAEALERYTKLQKRWRLLPYEELIAREGIDKTLANIMLRFHEDALESFKPKSRRDIRALYALCALIPALPLAIFYSLSSSPDFGENVESVKWLPNYASQVSYYRSKQVQVYEFTISPENFNRWARSNQMKVQHLSEPEILSRYKAYLPVDKTQQAKPITPDNSISAEQFKAWQSAISITMRNGLIVQNTEHRTGTVIYDPHTHKAYVENLIND